MNATTWVSPNGVEHALTRGRCATCGRTHPAPLEHVRTDALEPGDRVALPGRLERTVSSITPTGYANSRNEPIVTVWYLEGHTEEWSAGNTAIGSSLWRVQR